MGIGDFIKKNRTGAYVGLGMAIVHFIMLFLVGLFNGFPFLSQYGIVGVAFTAAAFVGVAIAYAIEGLVGHWFVFSVMKVNS